MASFLSQVFSCWTSAFSAPTEWAMEEKAKEQAKSLPTTKKVQEVAPEPKREGKTEGKVVITQKPEPSSTIQQEPQEYESTVEWDCWDDEEDERQEQPKDVEVPTISLPTTSIKATVVSGNSYDNVINKKKEKEEEPEEDFFSDMEPEVVPAKKVFVEEKLKPTSSRIKMSLDMEEDIEIGEGWGVDEGSHKRSSGFATSGVEFDFDDDDELM